MAEKRPINADRGPLSFVPDGGRFFAKLRHDSAFKAMPSRQCLQDNVVGVTLRFLRACATLL